MKPFRVYPEPPFGICEAQSIESGENMVQREDLEYCLHQTLMKGGDFADVYYEHRQGNMLVCERGQVERQLTGLEQGVGVRLVNGGTAAYAFSNNLSRTGMAETAAVVRETFNGRNRVELPPISLVPPRYQLTVEKRPDTVSLSQKSKLILLADTAAREIDSRIRQVTVSYADTIQKVILLNSDGEWTEDERVRTRLAINVVAAEGSKIQTGYESLGGFGGFEIMESSARLVADTARNAARRALQMLTARSAPAGLMPVILAGEAGGTMIHEACGHGLEADHVEHGISVYGDMMEQMVASPLISVVDDATLAGRYGSYHFDDEGIHGQSTVLIEQGRLVGFLYDRMTARRAGRQSTGNGRRESYQHRPVPRMSNTFIRPGTDDPAAIIKDTRQGILVKRMGGGQVNTVTGDFVFEVAEAYLIENGEIGPAIKGATLTGNGPEVLKRVERVGNDLGFSIGTCGKEGQGVPVGDAQPTLFIREMVVGGVDAAAE